MINTFLGTKQRPTQVFLEDGTRIPVTEISVPENTVVSIRTKSKNGYTGLLLCTGIRKKATKAQIGQVKGANLKSAPYFLKEVDIDEKKEVSCKIGDAIKVHDVLKDGDIVSVTGTSKGKGFAGVVRRHHFKGGPKTHGQSDRERAPGSIGQSTTPGRVYKGKRMAGRMGHEKVTVKNLKVVDINDGKLLIKGLVPGIKGSLLVIKKTGEDKKFVPLHKIVDEKPATQKAQNGEEGTEEVQENSKTEKVEEVEKVEGGNKDA